jgi:hypothetical protein
VTWGGYDERVRIPTAWDPFTGRWKFGTPTVRALMQKQYGYARRMSSARVRVTIAAAFLIGAGLDALGCDAHSREPADFVEGFSECSLIPHHTICRCDGKLEPAAREDEKDPFCGHVATVCVGHAFDCKTTSS